MVLRTDWMDQRTKQATLEKNRKMESQIGFPDWLFTENELDEYYENVRNCSSFICLKYLTAIKLIRLIFR